MKCNYYLNTFPRQDLSLSLCFFFHLDKFFPFHFVIFETMQYALAYALINGAAIDLVHSSLYRAKRKMKKKKKKKKRKRKKKERRTGLVTSSFDRCVACRNIFSRKRIQQTSYPFLPGVTQRDSIQREGKKRKTQIERERDKTVNSKRKENITRKNNHFSDDYNFVGCVCTQLLLLFDDVKKIATSIRRRDNDSVSLSLSIDLFQKQY